MHQCERRDSSSGSSSYVRSSAKETKVSSSRRKPSLSSQWDSDDSTSESHVENYSDSVGRYLGLCNRDYRRQSGGSNEDAKRRKTEVSLGLSETPKSIAKNSVQVNGIIKVTASSELRHTVGAHNSHRSAPAAGKSKSSKQAKHSSRGTSESSFSAEKPSHVHSIKSDSSRLSPVASKTQDRCDSSYEKSHVDNSHAFTACRTKDSSLSTKDKQCIASYSPKSDRLCGDSSISVKQNGKERLTSSNSCKSSNVHSDGGHRKSKRTTAVEISLNHRQNCGTDSVSLPAVSRSSPSEECLHVPVSSKSTVILPSPKLNHGRPRVGTTVTDTRLSDRSSVDRDSVSSFSNMPVHEPLKSSRNSLVEPSRSSSSKPASKTALCSGSGQDLPHRTHRHHQSKSGSTNSGSLHSTEISKSKLDLKTGPKLGLEPKLGDSFNGKTFPVEQQNIPPSRRGHLSNNMSLVATDDTIIKHENPSLGIGPENKVVNCLSAKVPKSQDNLKSSAQFCKGELHSVCLLVFVAIVIIFISISTYM